LKIVWTLRAAQNRDTQLDYIGQENAEAAIRVDFAIDNQVRQLKDFPELGRIGRLEGTRELVIAHTSLVVVYAIRKDAISILRLLHGAQMYP
jgi:toxin ParE1/3/4